jgi:hypothetical protein
MFNLSAFAQSPSINRTTPLSLVPGQTNVLTVQGENLSTAPLLWTSFPAAIETIDGATADKKSSEARFRIAVPAGLPAGIVVIRIATTNGVSNWHLLLLDPLGAHEVPASNGNLAQAFPLNGPGAFEGACSEREFEFFQFASRRNQRFHFEIVAHRIGSALDPIVRVLDAGGKEFAYCDDALGAVRDAIVSFQAPAKGNFYLELRDVTYSGGSKHFYHLRFGTKPLTKLKFLPLTSKLSSAIPSPDWTRIVEKEPNDQTNRATRITWPCTISAAFQAGRDRDLYEFNVAQPQRLVFAGRSRSLGSPCDLRLRLLKPDGSALAESKVLDTQDGSLTNAFEQSGKYFLLVEELSQQGDPELWYRLDVAAFQPGFELSVETEKVEIDQGGTTSLKVTAQRWEYDGAIQLSIAGLGFDCDLDDAVIGEKKKETTLKVRVPGQVEPGTLTHFQLLGRATAGPTDFVAVASTMPALKKAFPQMLNPPMELDGWIAMSVRSLREKPKPPGSPPAEK